MKLEVSAILFFVLNSVESRKMKRDPCDHLHKSSEAYADCVNF